MNPPDRLLFLKVPLPVGQVFGLPALVLMLLLPGIASADLHPPGAPPAQKKPEAGSPSLQHFFGRLDSLDLSHHPMTLTATLRKDPFLVFLFGGVLVPDTMVYSGGRTVGVRALKKGTEIEIDYRETPKGTLIRKILLLPTVPKGTDNRGQSNTSLARKLSGTPSPASSKPSPLKMT